MTSKKVKGYTSLTGAQYALIMGLALSGLSTFTTTYDAISGLDQTDQQLPQSVKDQLRTRYITILVISCLAFVAGIGAGYYFGSQDGEPSNQLLSFGLMAFSIVGIIYSIFVMFSSTKGVSYVKLGLSWTSLIAFVILGYMYQTKNEWLLKYIGESQ